MATTDVGKIKQIFKGAYSSGTSYLPDDIVTYVSETYICILASTANLPTNATYWAKIINKGTDGSNANPLNVAGTVQGDIYYNSGGALARLAPGTSGTLLRTNGAAANPSWNALSGGQVATTSYVTRTTQGGFGTTSPQAVTGMNVSITPTSASSKILILVSFCGETQWSQWDGAYTLFRTIGGSTVNLATSKGGSQGSYAWGFSACYDSYTGDNASSTPGGTFFSHIDLPSTTSAVTYALGAAGGGTLYINRCVDDASETGGSRITAIEIALS